MRAVVQRVSHAEVRVDNQVVGKIGPGALVYLGISTSDEVSDASSVAQKIAQLRIFDDDQGKMNRSLLDVGGSALVVSQFTLFGDCRGSRRPSYTQAAPPAKAEELYEYFLKKLREHTVPVETGVFRAMMEVESVNNGPVTILLDSQKLF